MEVGGDPDDFMKVFNSLDKNSVIYRDVKQVIRSLKDRDELIGVHLQRNKVPKHYIKKHGVDAYYKVELPDNWRLIYGIISIQGMKKALLMELFDHVKYNKRFRFKKK